MVATRRCVHAVLMFVPHRRTGGRRCGWLADAPSRRHRDAGAIGAAPVPVVSRPSDLVRGLLSAHRLCPILVLFPVPACGISSAAAPRRLPPAAVRWRACRLLYDHFMNIPASSAAPVAVGDAPLRAHSACWRTACRGFNWFAPPTPGIRPPVPDANHMMWASVALPILQALFRRRATAAIFVLIHLFPWLPLPPTTIQGAPARLAGSRDEHYQCTFDFAWRQAPRRTVLFVEVTKVTSVPGREIGLPVPLDAASCRTTVDSRRHERVPATK